LNRGQGHIISVAGDDGLVEKVEAPQLVNAMDMVGVMVGVQHTINLGDVIQEALLPEIRGGVYQNVKAVILDQNGGSEALIARVVRLTDIAGTA
jgi:hypothetical protein